MQNGELTYNHTNETRRLHCGKKAITFTRIEYKNLCDSNERQTAIKKLITRGSSLYGPQLFGSNSARIQRTCYSLEIMLLGLSGFKNFACLTGDSSFSFLRGTHLSSLCISLGSLSLARYQLARLCPQWILSQSASRSCHNTNDFGKSQRGVHRPCCLARARPPGA